MTLAERINKVMKQWDSYCYTDSDCSVEYFEDLLKNSPDTVLIGLLDLLDDVLEELKNN